MNGDVPLPEIASEAVQLSEQEYPKSKIKVKSITSICEDNQIMIDNDVIIPTEFPSDSFVEISEEDETIKKQAHADALSLQSQVNRLVKLSLHKFYQIEDGISSEEEMQVLTEKFSKQFVEEITIGYLETNRTTAGIKVTEDHKRSIVDQLIFFFEIKKSVNMNLRKHMNPSLPQFMYLSSELSNKFCNELLETHFTMHNSLAGLSFTSDSHQWIGNIIARQLMNK